MRPLQAAPLAISAAFTIALSFTVPAPGNAGGEFPVVQLDVSSGFIPELEQAIWITDAAEITIPIVLDRTVTNFGAVSWTAWNEPPTNGSVTFPDGATSGSYSFGFSSPAGIPFTPGWELTDVLTYIHSPEDLTMGDLNVMHAGRVVEVGSGSARGGACIARLLWRLLCSLAGTCHDGGRGGDPPELDVLRRYSDEILASTVEGQYYIDQYTLNSLDLARAAFKEPDFFARFARMQGEWVGAIGALVNGNGDGAVVTTAMEANLLSLLDSIEATGTPELAAKIAFERARLGLDAIAGLTIAQFQSQVESLGGATSVEPRSWGGVKALYR